MMIICGNLATLSNAMIWDNPEGLNDRECYPPPEKELLELECRSKQFFKIQLLTFNFYLGLYFGVFILYDYFLTTREVGFT